MGIEIPTNGQQRGLDQAQSLARILACNHVIEMALIIRLVTKPDRRHPLRLIITIMSARNSKSFQSTTVNEPPLILNAYSRSASHPPTIVLDLDLI